MYGAGHQVSDGRTADGSQRGVQRAVRQLHPLPQSPEARRGQVHSLTGNYRHRQPLVQFSYNIVRTNLNKWKDCLCGIAAFEWEIRYYSSWIPCEDSGCKQLSLTKLCIDFYFSLETVFCKKKTTQLDSFCTALNLASKHSTIINIQTQ